MEQGIGAGAGGRGQTLAVTKEAGGAERVRACWSGWWEQGYGAKPCRDRVGLRDVNVIKQ